MRLSFILTLSMLLLSMLVVFAETADVSGTWTFTRQTPRGELTSDIVITQDGNEITVESQSMRGETITSKGTIKGNTIEWTTEMESPNGGAFKIIHNGTVDGDTMKGTMSFEGSGGRGPGGGRGGNGPGGGGGNRPSNEWTATRAE